MTMAHRLEISENEKPTSSEVICGPLLNFKGLISRDQQAAEWTGSVLLITKATELTPELHLKLVRPVKTDKLGNGALDFRDTRVTQHIKGVRLYADPEKVFWRFTIELELSTEENIWEYKLCGASYKSELSESITKQFVVQSVHQSMRIMFHSCNGFSVGTDEEAWSGPALWNDVLRIHALKPFHVMIGGGDQIYNDGVRVDGPLKAWTDIRNPHRRREYPFGRTLRKDCDDYYLTNYLKWYSAEPFASANSTIPQVNIWDDHDIIDGFGSYSDHFMKCSVFRGIGGIAFKYYCLFQHHVAPPISTFTTDSAATQHAQHGNSAGADAQQLADTFVLQEKSSHPSWIFGQQPGPYVEERSRSVYMQLGSRVGFLGLDARTERTRHQVNYPDTYDRIFARLQAELTACSDIRHLIVLLGVPIAYPRLAWLENIFTSPIIGPIRFLSRRFGIAGGLFNKFDGQVDLLDDLDDHYTAHHHKRERKALLLRLQALAKAFSVRVTILGGDVHLGAIGRFYSNSKHEVAIENDFRYMPNIISSAITNKPPPKAVADLLARRNKIHHLDHFTDETLMNIFDRDPGEITKTAKSNRCTMPSRNFAIITENQQNTTNMPKFRSMKDEATAAAMSHVRDGHEALHKGEESAGTLHPAASGVDHGNIPGGLDVSLRVEVDQQNGRGSTTGFGFSIPALDVMPHL